MRWQIWRSAAIVLAALGLGLMVVNILVPSGSWGFDATRTDSQGGLRVTRILPERDIRPDLHVGDVIRLHDHSLAQRLRFLRSRPGETFVFDGAHGPPVTVRIVTHGDQLANWIFTPICLAFISMGTLLALRRPRQGEVRALAAVLLLFGVLMTMGVQAWMQPWMVLLALLGLYPVQMAGLASAVELATTFPDPQARGARRVIRWSNYVLSPFFAALGMWAVVWSAVEERALPRWVTIVGSYPWVYYVVAITAAFWIANVRAQGADRWRVRWVSVAVGVAFSGIVAELALIVVAHVRADWVGYLPLTMIALPFGLGYAIVRHRVIDIGFVINRALVFGILSAVVIVAFMVLEWALSTVFVKVSHVTSTSLEILLALVLGFFLRGIHGRVDAFIEDLFFRARHENERALKTFAREVAYVTDPRVALARTHAELVARAGTADVAVYVVAGRDAVRVDPAEVAAQDRVDIDDPALVRMRATRQPLALAHVTSAFAGDRAFPMCVRDTITGAVVLGAKTNGEAYAPDEIATIETVVLALGNALDALQTAALKAEVARVVLDGAPVEALRRTVDAAAWVRGVVPQPAGSLPGLGE